MSTGMLPGVVCIAKGKALLPWFTSDELEVRARSSIISASQLLPVAIEGSGPVVGDLFPRTYAMLSVDYELKEKQSLDLQPLPKLPFLG